MLIRSASDDDAARLVEIYAPYVQGTAISFETDVLGVSEMVERVRTSIAWLVAQDDAAILGYAYAGPFASRAAYAWSVEISVYLDQEARGRGVGGRLLDTLLEQLGSAGYVNVSLGSHSRMPPARDCSSRARSSRSLGFATSGSSLARGTMSAGGSDSCESQLHLPRAFESCEVG